MNQTEEQLNALQRGDRAAYEQLYEYYPMIRAFINKNKGTNKDAEDVFQEGLITFLTKIRQPDFKLTAKISTYIYGIVRNKWLHILRDRRDTISIEDTHKEFVEEGDSILEKEIFEAQDFLVQKVIQTLGEDCRTLLLKYYIQQKALGEIATLLNYSNKFVKVKKGRCMDALRKKILAHPDYQKYFLE